MAENLNGKLFGLKSENSGGSMGPVERLQKNGRIPEKGWISFLARMARLYRNHDKGLTVPTQSKVIDDDNLKFH